MSIEREHFIKSIAYLFRETFEGSPEGQGSAYLDRGIGFFSVLDSLSAGEASKSVNGSTIAAQTEHAKFYLDRLCEYLTGRTEPVKWEQSWLIESVNEEEWTALRNSARRSYEGTLRTIAEKADWPETSVGEALAMLAHTAYHLGSIRQIAKAVRNRDDNA
jgi:hypothetical protein